MRITSSLIVLALLFAGCGPGQQEKKAKQPELSVLQDSTHIFNGTNLDGWEITNFGPQGPVYISDSCVIMGMGDGCTGINFLKQFPVSDYELTLDAKRVDGNDFFCGITFPAGGYPCTLIIGGWGGTVVGLSSINGLDASENETTVNRSFEKGRWYAIRLKVTENKIEAWIDYEKLVDFEIGDNVLSIRPEVELSKPFGITSWRTTAALRNIKMISIPE